MRNNFHSIFFYIFGILKHQYTNSSKNKFELKISSFQVATLDNLFHYLLSVSVHHNVHMSRDGCVSWSYLFCKCSCMYSVNKAS